MADFKSRAEKIQSESWDHPTVPSSKSDGGVLEATRVSLKVLKLPQTWQHLNMGKNDHLKVGGLPETEALNPR